MFIGKTIYGFCNGYFGRDTYSTKTIEAEGYDWIVARDENQIPYFASFIDEDEKNSLILQWTKDLQID